MKAVYFSAELPELCEVREYEIPKPGRDEILVKNVAVASNPKDWKLPLWIKGYGAVEGNVSMHPTLPVFLLSASLLSTTTAAATKRWLRDPTVADVWPRLAPLCATHWQDIAGYVHQVGSDVTDFKEGDRVSAMHGLCRHQTASIPSPFPSLYQRVRRPTRQLLASITGHGLALIHVRANSPLAMDCPD